MAETDSKSFRKAPAHTKVKVLNNQWVPKKLYLQIKQDAAFLITKMVPGRRYRLENLYEICGEGFWLALGNAWVRRKAGRAFAHMVSLGMFPVRFNPYKRYATMYYSLVE